MATLHHCAKCHHRCHDRCTVYDYDPDLRGDLVSPSESATCMEFRPERVTRHKILMGYWVPLMPWWGHGRKRPQPDGPEVYCTLKPSELRRAERMGAIIERGAERRRHRFMAAHLDTMNRLLLKVFDGCSERGE